MKPRIRIITYRTWPWQQGVIRFYCYSENSCGFGNSIYEAYQSWLADGGE